ncbi:hypothetical protein [Actinoplanes sp. ATCC 53533]|nr:hypothetical protein [Actinoplanes sp. ATCC 53533]
MLWHTSITPQRHTPRGEVTTTCAGQSGSAARTLRTSERFDSKPTTGRRT